MKRTYVVMFALLFASFLFAGANPVKGNVVVHAPSMDRDDVIYWQEGFEDGLNGWTSADDTAPADWAEWWHLSTEGAYDGNSWWMGDEAIGGYTNHRYLVLDTPMIELPTGTPELTFMMHYLMESTGGVDDYDAWDGFNVRVSTDGTTWTVIDGDPSYDAESFYSFGFEFNEGVNIPGYGGTNDGWEEYAFDLSDYAGQEIMIRFAFASDPAACTDDGDGDEDWFGVRIDDINVAGVFESDGDGATGDEQMVPGYGGVASGDFWAISDVNANSGDYSIHCPVEPNLLDELYSPVVNVPDLPEVYFGYYVFCDMIDSNGDGDPDGSLEDYYLVYIKGEEEDSWTRLHYLFNDATSGGLPSDWTYVNQAWALENLSWQTDASCDITDWAGMSVQFRFEIKTDDNDDGGVGDGMYIDDVMIYAPVFLPSPTNLTAEATVENQIQLEWENPMASGEPGWLHWDNGTNDDGIGINAAGILDAAARFTASDLLPYTGFHVTSIKIYPREANCDYTLYIWDTGATVLYSQDITPTVNEWNEISLDTPYEIQLGDELWIGYRADTQQGHPLGCDAGPAVRGTSYIRMNNGGWTELYEAGENPLDYNWNIQAYVDTPVDFVYNPVPLTTRDITGYKIFRSSESGNYNMETPIVEITDSETTEYLDENPVANSTNYYIVVATYDDGDSQPSNEASAYVLSQTAEEMAYDDGEADDDFMPSPGQLMAVKFTPYVHPDVDNIDILQMKIWVEDIGTMNSVVKVWDDDGTDGAPGTELDAFVLATGDMLEGWNIVDLTNIIPIESGSFYLGFMGSPNSSAYGVDTGVNGYSFTGTTAGEWTGWADGQFMIRAIIDTHTGVSEELAPAPVLSAKNYPNPFNPTTTISYNVPKDGKVTVKVFNTKGQLVKTLVNEVVAAGSKTVVWTGDNNEGKKVSSGVYMYKVETENESVLHKMLLLK